MHHFRGRLLDEDKTRLDPTRRVLIYERDGVTAGVVNFFDLELDATPRTGAWGFYLDADGLAERGETLPAWIEVMKEATARFKGRVEGKKISDLVARLLGS